MTWKEIPVHDFSPHLNDVIIDVREIDEYQDGHVPGAVNVPLSLLEQSFSSIPTSGTVYMICRSGARSGRACDFLIGQNSHQDVTLINIGGGTAGWIAEGREVVSGDSPA